MESLPPFIKKTHYEATPTCAYWFNLKTDITIDLGIPIYGRASFRDATNREWGRLDDDALTIRAKYAWDGPTMAPKFKRCMLPSLLHDFLCQMLETQAMMERIDKAKADLLFYEAMRVSGFTLRGPFYHAVRKFGHLFAKRHNVHSVVLP